MKQNIFILGATGHVGSETIKQVAEFDTHELGVHENPTSVVGLANSREYMMIPGGIPRDILIKFSADTGNRDRLRHLFESLPSAKGGFYIHANQILDTLNQLGMNGDVVFVDATSSRQEMRNFQLKIIQESTHKIVTANKNPLSLFSYADYQILTKDPNRYKYSATTMAGLGAVPWISERAAIDDQIQEFKASLSGTLGFISGELSKGKRLSEAIRDAKEHGYTEPDFRDDLSGKDVARKLIILARDAGFSVDISDIEIEPYIPQNYFDIKNPEDCLHQIEDRLDPEMVKQFKSAQLEGKTWRYLASLRRMGEKVALKVGFVKVPIDSAFGRLSGTDNRLEVITNYYNAKRPYKLEGPGAGLEVTAATLRQDLFKLLPTVSRHRL